MEGLDYWGHALEGNCGTLLSSSLSFASGHEVVTNYFSSAINLSP